MNNYEKIKAMTIEEMAFCFNKTNFRKLFDCAHCERELENVCRGIHCVHRIKHWLEQEALH